MELLFLGILVLLMITALVSGFPVAFSLPGSSIIAIGLAALAGWMFADDPNAYFHEGGPVQWLSAGVTNFRSLYWNVERDTLIAIPLFIFMGIMLQRSKVAEDLLVTMAQLFGPCPRWLGYFCGYCWRIASGHYGHCGCNCDCHGYDFFTCHVAQ